MRSLSTLATLLLGLAVVAVASTAYGASLQSQIDALQVQIDAIELTPGPPGAPGPAGADGTDGATGPQGPAGVAAPGGFEFFGYSISNTVSGDAGYVGLTWPVLTEMGYPFGSLQQLLLLLGQRRSEVAEMQFQLIQINRYS